MAVRRKLKKSVKISLIVIACLIVLTILILNIIKKENEHKKYLESYEYKLSEKGYSEDEVKYLLEQSDDLKNKLLDVDYDEKIVDFTKEKYFILNNLEKYLSFYKKNTSSKLELNKVVSLVNVGATDDYYENTKESKSDEYNLILVNKYNYLKEEFEPKDIVDVKNWYCYGENKASKEAYENFISMFNDAKEKNLKLIISSGYRSFQEQKETYDSYVDRYGIKQADKLAARPGYSEHETGLALDITTGNATKDTFESTEEFKWLVDNSYKYGFILRYPKDKQDITGFDYEPWHYRYVGIETAKKIHELDITFDEYYAYYIAN